MNGLSHDAIEERRQYVEAWNDTMVSIWRERVYKLKVLDTSKLYHSITALNVHADGRFVELVLQQQFLEYGLWQDLGTGYGYRHENGGDLEFLDDDYRQKHGLNKPKKRGPKWGGGYTSGEPRERRRWLSPKYYSSVMNLKDFMAESLGDEFKQMVCRGLDTDYLRKNSQYYQSKGWS